jgi:DNA-binding transcriptional MerR regulator
MEAARQLEPSEPGDGYLTIEELAAQVGMSVRNLREWKTLGLLPAAELRGRVGYYHPSVIDRIRRIGELRAEGFKLELISRMLDTGGEAGEEVMRLAGTLRAPFAGRPELAAARMAEIGKELAGLGMSEQQILDATAAIREHADAIAELFEGVWREHVWEPFVAAGMPAEKLPEIVETAARVRPLAFDGVMAIFTVAMEAQIEQGIERELGRAGNG